MPSIHLRLRGRVQGVGFRWFIRVHARRLDLAGWVANNPDGSVEVAASGEKKNLDELEHVIRRGPDGANVSTVETLPPVDELKTPFTTR